MSNTDSCRPEYPDSSLSLSCLSERQSRVMFSSCDYLGRSPCALAPPAALTTSHAAMYPQTINEATQYGEWRLTRRPQFDCPFPLYAQPPPASLPTNATEKLHANDIRLTLQNAALWKDFHGIGTEMIITKSGRRMFPQCRLAAKGLDPAASYIFLLELIPADGSKYKWHAEVGSWEVIGPAEPALPSRTYIHPDSPASGAHWMRAPISFLKVKVTNNMTDQHGYIILHSMHKYQPRIHVIPGGDSHMLSSPAASTFLFPETEFIAVTAYQNSKIASLKIDHNPYAKGFRKDGRNHKRLCSKQERKKQKMNEENSDEKGSTKRQCSSPAAQPHSTDPSLGSICPESFPELEGNWVTMSMPEPCQLYGTDANTTPTSSTDITDLSPSSESPDSTLGPVSTSVSAAADTTFSMGWPTGGWPQQQSGIESYCGSPFSTSVPFLHPYNAFYDRRLYQPYHQQPSPFTYDCEYQWQSWQY
uniref:T-box transcription factor 16 n=1 Tax=Eptatretus burgeri TaxID=7764 RepID=A0A8C4N2K3_EPTBU